MQGQRSGCRFFHDECLPKAVGRALALVEHPIDTPADLNLAGARDEVLIPWMAERGYVWITKDEAAIPAAARRTASTRRP